MKNDPNLVKMMVMMEKKKKVLGEYSLYFLTVLAKNLSKKRNSEYYNNVNFTTGRRGRRGLGTRPFHCCYYDSTRKTTLHFVQGDQKSVSRFKEEEED